jgi:hypothetical protein
MVTAGRITRDSSNRDREETHPNNRLQKEGVADHEDGTGDKRTNKFGDEGSSKHDV